VLAPAQCGVHSPDRASHGRSLIVIRGASRSPSSATRGRGDRRLSLAELERVRASVPALTHRRL